MPKRYQIQGIQKETREVMGNTCTVHETFAVLQIAEGQSVPPYKVIRELSDQIGLDVILIPPGVELSVLKIVDPKDFD